MGKDLAIRPVSQNTRSGSRVGIGIVSLSDLIFIGCFIIITGFLEPLLVEPNIYHTSGRNDSPQGGRALGDRVRSSE